MIGWLDLAIVPVQVGFTVNKKSLRDFFKSIGDPMRKGEEGDDVGAIVHFGRKGHDTLCIVYLPKVPDGVSDVQVAAMLAHEALHIVQKVYEVTRETVRGELEAYLLQAVFQFLYGEYKRLK